MKKDSENPFQKFDTAFALMAVVPMLGFVFIATRGGSWNVLEGRGGFVMFLLIVISLLGYWLGYRVIRRLFEQLVNYNRALNRMNELKSVFVSEVSHEVKNPLVTLKMGLSFLNEDIQDALSGEQREVIAGCQRSIERLIRLTTDLLDLARIEAESMPVKQQNILLRPLLDEVEHFMRPHIEKKHLKFAADFEGENHAFLGDRDHLTRVLINLIDNAIKYTPEDCDIGVRLSAEKEYIKVDVWNAGEEIPAAKQDEIFERYRRITLGREAGNGLGLAIVKELVKLNRGDIRLERLNSQNHFIVRLPRASRPGLAE